MPRERTTSFRCGEGGCRETTFYTYANQREYAEIMQSQKRRPYRCSRHRDPEQVLRPDNLERSHVLVASKERAGLYWKAEGAEHAGSGLIHGPGFTAHASDFPEGTRLIVTARIDLPESGAPS